MIFSNKYWLCFFFSISIAVVTLLLYSPLEIVLTHGNGNVIIAAYMPDEEAHTRCINQCGGIYRTQACEVNRLKKIHNKNITNINTTTDGTVVIDLNGDDLYLEVSKTGYSRTLSRKHPNLLNPVCGVGSNCYQAALRKKVFEQKIF
jgi:hypothetical protein